MKDIAIKSVAITGEIGAGKSTVGNLLQEKNYQVFNADKMTEELYRNKEFLLKLEGILGQKITGEAKAQVRVYLYHNQEDIYELESLVHGYIKEKFQKELDSKGGEGIKFFEVPLLFEAGMEQMFDLIILLKANKETRYKRMKSREAFDEKFLGFLERRLVPIDEKEAKSDFVIENNGHVGDLARELDRILDIVKKN